MPRRDLPVGRVRAVWFGAEGGKPEESSPCARSCCWSPYGHSTARDGIPKWHRGACHCHEKQSTEE